MFQILKLPITVFYLFLATQIGYCNDLSKHTKAKWITQALSSLPNGEYPNVKAVSWWNENFDETKLRIDSSEESLTAYQKGISLPLYISNANIVSNKLYPPSNGFIYHAANPGFGSTEDNVTSKRIRKFEMLSKKILSGHTSQTTGMIP